MALENPRSTLLPRADQPCDYKPIRSKHRTAYHPVPEIQCPMCQHYNISERGFWGCDLHQKDRFFLPTEG